MLKNNQNNLQKENIILAVGRLTPQKGYDLLLSRIDEINLDGWRFIILGEGPEETKLKDLSKCKVEFHGFQDPHEYYAKAKIYIQPSKYEGFGNALVEALLHNCSCIAFDCNYGPSDILNEENGFLIENQNIDLFISTLNKVIKEDIRIKQTENKFSVEKHINNFISLIESV